MGANIEMPAKVWSILNLVWALFFISVGFINIYVMFNYDTDTWVEFKTFGVPILMGIFVLFQVIGMYKYLPDPEPEEAEK